MWGYNMQVTDEALDQIARAMRDRDVTIAYLQERLANRDAEEPATAQVRPPADALDALEALRTAGDPAPAPLSRSSQAPGTLVAPLPSRATPPPEVAHPAEVTQPPEVAQPWEVPEPPEATQPSEVAPPPEDIQPSEVAEPPEATQASETFPAPDEAQGPQGSFDTHGWWSQQEEAAREEETRRLAAAQEAHEVPPADADASEPGASSSHPDPSDDDSLGATEEQSW
jgi:hypothetical protein